MLNFLHNFNIENSSLALWVYRKRIVKKEPFYTGRWVSITNDLKNELKKFIVNERRNYQQLIEYELLADSNENRLLHIQTDETEARKIIECSLSQTEEKKATKENHLDNIDFYSIKLVHEDKTLHCIKKADSSWKTKKKSGLQSLFFQDNTLDVDNRPKFDIAKSFDFYILDQHIYIKSKLLFESILSYKQAHIENFQELAQELSFSSLFDTIAPLQLYVGNNAMQLRRASAIKQKGFYRSEAFMESLRQNVQDFRLNIQFDQNGKIIVTENNCADIFQALLDHRLQSHYRPHIYDVPNAMLLH